MNEPITYDDVNRLLHAVGETDEALSMKCCAAMDGDARAWAECERAIVARRAVADAAPGAP